MAWRVKRSASGSASAGQPAAKVQKTGSAEISLVTAVARLCLSNTMAIHDLQAAAFTTFILQGNTPGIRESKEAIAAYIATTKEEGPDHGRGPLHLQAGLSFLEGLAEGTKEAHLEAEVAAVKAWVEEAGRGGVEDASAAMPIFRIGRCFQKNTNKLQIRINNRDFEKTIGLLLKAHGAKRKDGPPPKTELERIIQRALDGGSKGAGEGASSG